MKAISCQICKAIFEAISFKFKFCEICKRQKLLNTRKKNNDKFASIYQKRYRQKNKEKIKKIQKSSIAKKPEFYAKQIKFRNSKSYRSKIKIINN